MEEEKIHPGVPRRNTEALVQGTPQLNATFRAGSGRSRRRPRWLLWWRRGIAPPNQGVAADDLLVYTRNSQLNVRPAGSKLMPAKLTTEEIWSAFLTGPLLGKVIKSRRRLLTLFPATHRCKNCNAPFDGAGALLMPLIGHGQYRKNPRFCKF